MTIEMRKTGVDVGGDMPWAWARRRTHNQRSSSRGSQLLVSVGDTGVELKPEEAEKVFNAFYTTKDQGTGMGLPISHSIIESHGGRMWVAPNSGRGSIFQFTLTCEVIAHQAA
jgi:signal transduction histidine kinase